MRTEFVINGGVTLVLGPENSMEEEILKKLIKQSNEIIEVRTAVTVLGKVIRGSVLICSKDSFKQEPEETVKLELVKLDEN